MLAAGRIWTLSGPWGIFFAYDCGHGPSQSSGAEGFPAEIRRYAGEVVYIYAFDVAYEMTRQPVRELLGQPVAQFVVDASKRSPRQLFFYRPQMVRLPPLERIGPRGPVRVERVIKLLPVGRDQHQRARAVRSESGRGLVCYHDLQFSNGIVERRSAAAGRRGAQRTGRASTSGQCANLRRKKPTPCSASTRRC